MSQMQDQWYEIAVEVAREQGDAAAALLAASGFAGCEMRERGGASFIVVFAQAPGLDEARILAATAAGALPAAVLPAGRGDTAPVVTVLDPEVWTQNWRRHFARHTIGGRIEIVPPWESPSPESAGVLSIVINPGMAFGTGLHETTSGCLEALIETVRPGDRVLDVGCGSAILAIAAARLGSREAVAIDNDPIAIEAALENIEGNGVGNLVQAGMAPTDSVSVDASGTNVASEIFDAPFDVVVANILAETLVDMRDWLVARVGDAGTLILSGIEAGRARMVLDAFAHPDWTVGPLLERGEWVTVVLHRKAFAQRS